jgi:hypothetical protein
MDGIVVSLRFKSCHEKEKREEKTFANFKLNVGKEIVVNLYYPYSGLFCA